MASLTCQSSPTSLQLQFCLRLRGPPPLSTRIRFIAPDRRMRLTCAAGAPASAGGPAGSWNGVDSSVDSFAGWSGPDGVHVGAESKKKGRVGGLLGSGLAGLVFAAGVAYASLNLISRTTSGATQHMGPLAVEQEVSLTSDDWNVKVDQVSDESSAVLPDKQSKIDSNLGSETDKSNGLFPFVGINEDDTEDRPDDVHPVESSAVHNTEPTDNGVDFNSALVSSDSNHRSPESSAYDASSLKESHSSDSTNHTTDNLDVHISPEETVDSALTIVESDSIIDFDNEDVEEPAASISMEQDSEPGSTSDQVVLHINETVPSEIIGGSGFDKSEGTPSVVYSQSLSSEWDGNVSDISTESEIARNLSFDSLPEGTISHAGIPAPSLVSEALHLSPGKVLVPAVVDQAQGQALAALQVLKVIEADIQPGDLCTRREYARWLVAASSALSRNTISKVYPAMYIENVTQLAFDDITPENPDFSYIQGLAEAGIISSKLSRSDLNGSFSEQHDPFLFCPESPLSRQDLVSWKMALERRLLPGVNRDDLYQSSGYIDIDKIGPDAWPALLADLSAGEQSITSLAFGYTRLFQPNKPVTKAQAAIALATGESAEVVGEELTRIEAESLAESAVNAHTDLVAQVEKDLNVSFEKELSKEREKIDALEKLAEEARLELERIKAEREEENSTLIWGRAAVESEMQVLSRLRHEVEEQLQKLMSNKVEISFERDRIDKLRKEAENHNQVIVQLQYELEVERKALSMARSWAEEEGKRAREQARVLEEARNRWESHDIKVIVDEDLQDDASAGISFLTSGEQQPVAETVNRAESLVAKLREMAAEIKLKSSNVIEKIIQKIVALISVLKKRASEASRHAEEFWSAINAKMIRSGEEFQEKSYELVSKTSRSLEGIRGEASEFSSRVGEKARRVAEDCKGSVDKITQRFRT